MGLKNRRRIMVWLLGPVLILIASSQFAHSDSPTLVDRNLTPQVRSAEAILPTPQDATEQGVWVNNVSEIEPVIVVEEVEEPWVVVEETYSSIDYVTVAQIAGIAAIALFGSLFSAFLFLVMKHAVDRRFAHPTNRDRKLSRNIEMLGLADLIYISSQNNQDIPASLKERFLSLVSEMELTEAEQIANFSRSVANFLFQSDHSKSSAHGGAEVNEVEEVEEFSLLRNRLMVALKE